MSIFGTGTDAVPISKFIYALRVWTSNQNIDFKEYTGGAEMSAAVDADHYLPDNLATAVAAAMNDATSGASGASADYDCSYDRATDKFTITQSDPGILSDVLIDACSATTNWTTGGVGKELIVATGDSTQGASAFETGVSSGGIYGQWILDISSLNLTFEKVKKFLIDIKISDLDELYANAPVFFHLELDGSNYLKKVYQASALASSWNSDLGGITSDWDETGSATGAINTFRLFIGASSSDYEIVSGNLKIDNLRVDKAADGAFEILWNSGASAASGAASALGFSATADDTGASAYTADSELPNRIVASQPIRKPRPEFDGLNRESISEAGLRSVQHRRTDIFFEFQISHIPEDELKDEWSPFLGKVDEVEGPWARGLAFEWYPKATAAASGDYIVFHPVKSRWQPDEMLPNLPGFYRWRMEMREVIPKAGSLSLVDIYTRTPG